MTSTRPTDMVHALLYVSRSTLILPEEEPQVARLVEVSRRLNHLDRITGALIFTEANFAQFVEGPPHAIAHLMQRLRADGRHTHLDVVVEGEASERRFAGWDMAYSGPALFLEDQMRPLVHRRPGDDVRDAAEDLIDLMHAFVGGGGTY